MVGPGSGTSSCAAERLSPLTRVPAKTRQTRYAAKAAMYVTRFPYSNWPLAMCCVMALGTLGSITYFTLTKFSLLAPELLFLTAPS